MYAKRNSSVHKHLAVYADQKSKAIPVAKRPPTSYALQCDT